MSTRRSQKLTAEELAALVDVGDEAATSTVTVRSADLPELPGEGGVRADRLPAPLDFVLDVPLEVRVVLGQTQMTVREVLELGAGAVVELDRPYAEPVDLAVNGCVVARGEVVVAGDHFGIRVTQIVSAGGETES